MAAQATQFDVLDEVLCYVGPRGGSQARKVVPKTLRKPLLDGYHRGALSGHFSGPKLLKTVSILDTGGGQGCII